MLLCSTQVYSTLYSLQQIVATYKLQVYIMVYCHLTSYKFTLWFIYSELLLQVTDQSVSYYTLVVFVLFVQSEAVQLQK